MFMSPICDACQMEISAVKVLKQRGADAPGLSSGNTASGHLCICVNAEMAKGCAGRQQKQWTPACFQ